SVIADNSFLQRPLLPLRTRGRFVETEINLLHPAGNRRPQRRERLLEHPTDFRGYLFAMLDCVGQTAPRNWVGIATAAYRYQRDCAWVVTLDRLLGAPGPITVNLVELAIERCAVAGIIQDERPNAPVRSHDPQHGKRMV